MSLKQEENQLHTVFSFAALRRKGQTQLSTTQKQTQYELSDIRQRRLTKKMQLYYINRTTQPKCVLLHIERQVII